MSGSKVVRLNETEQAFLENAVLSCGYGELESVGRARLFNKVKRLATQPVDWKDHSHDNETPQQWESNT